MSNSSFDIENNVSQDQQVGDADLQDSLAFNAIILAIAIGALVFFGDFLKQYGIGPRGADVSLMSMHTLFIILAVVYGFTTIRKVIQKLRE